MTDLSVVIAAHNAAAVIDTCLAAIDPQRHQTAIEVIVADSSTDATPVLVAKFPWVRLLHFDESLSVPALRGRGIAAADGRIIAILDPFSVVASDWVARVIAAHADQPHLVIGGSVGLYHAASASHALWTLYLNEYGLFMPPAVRGETWIVPGSNVTYKRTALFDGPVPRYPVFWKTFANDEIEQSRSPLWLEPAIQVELNKPMTFRDYFRTRYQHGRCYGGMRVRDAVWTIRVMRALSTPVVPVLLLWRWTRGFWPKGRARGRFALTMPAQFLLFGVWACGEACGYLRGSGRTCGQLFY